MNHSVAVITLLAVLLGVPGAATAEDPADATVADRSAERSHVDSSLIFARFDEEPEIDWVQEWAVQYARLSPFEASRLMRRARLRGALPTVRLHARYRTSTSKEWDEMDLVDGRDLDNDLSFNLWLEWDLAELAAGAAMARALRESRARLELRHAVVSQVTSDYFDRRLLLAEEQLSVGEDAAVMIARRLRVQELDATLDGLTGGRWSRALRSVFSEPGEDPYPGLRVPVHAAHRPTDP
jgi:hypothetical protein